MTIALEGKILHAHLSKPHEALNNRTRPTGVEQQGLRSTVLHPSFMIEYLTPLCKSHVH